LFVGTAARGPAGTVRLKLSGFATVRKRPIRRSDGSTGSRRQGTRQTRLHRAAPDRHLELRRL